MILDNTSHKGSLWWTKALDGLDLDGVLHVDSFLNLGGKLDKQVSFCLKLVNWWFVVIKCVILWSISWV